MNPTDAARNNVALNDFITKVSSQIITPLVTLIALAAFVLFVWGVVEYIRNAANDEKRKVGQQHILWGIIGLVLIFGASAVVKVIGTLATVFQ